MPQADANTRIAASRATQRQRDSREHPTRFISDDRICGRLARDSVCKGERLARLPRQLFPTIFLTGSSASPLACSCQQLNKHPMSLGSSVGRAEMVCNRSE